jgi:hypothetical protein
MSDHGSFLLIYILGSNHRLLFSSSVNPRSTDENQGESSKNVTGFFCTSHPLQPSRSRSTCLHMSQPLSLESHDLLLHIAKGCVVVQVTCTYLPHFLPLLSLNSGFFWKSGGFCCISHLVLLSRAHLYIYQSTLALLWELRIILVDRWT